MYFRSIWYSLVLVLAMYMKNRETNRMDTCTVIVFSFLNLAVAAGQPQRKPVSPASDNLTNCMKGLSNCDISVLSPDDLKQVSEASKKRNLDSCLDGSTLCD